MQQTLTPVNVATTILNACQELGEQIYFGEDVLVQALRGSNTHPVRFFNLKALHCFGKLSEIKAKPLLDAVAWLMREGFIYRADEKRPLLLVALEAMERIKSADLTEFASLLQVVHELVAQ